MTKDNPTPRTDAERIENNHLVDDMSIVSCEVVHADFARQLEQELQQAREELAKIDSTKPKRDAEFDSLTKQLSQWQECAREMHKAFTGDFMTLKDKLKALALFTKLTSTTTKE
jgi:predicted ATP-dependent serine protease